MAGRRGRNESGGNGRGDAEDGHDGIFQIHRLPFLAVILLLQVDVVASSPD